MVLIKFDDKLQAQSGKPGRVPGQGGDRRELLGFHIFAGQGCLGVILAAIDAFWPCVWYGSAKMPG